MDNSICHTESTMILRDVELAVDETMLGAALARDREMSRGNNSLNNEETTENNMPRRMSTNIRLSTRDNPFFEVSSRLVSKRIRPVVLELIIALGHYIDAVWSVTFPDKPCPWALPNSNGWRSFAISAVQDGKGSADVPNPQTQVDVEFWEEEVRYSLMEVTELVGPLSPRREDKRLHIGFKWAFVSAMIQGGYGAPAVYNLLGEKGEGGNFARLLNDLEEAIW
jgi:hypothetical protein